MLFWMSLFALMDGAFLIGAFAPFNVDYATFFLLAALLYALWRVTPKQALLIGFFFGLGFFGAGFSWIYISIHEYGNASTCLAGLLTFLLIAFLSLFPASLTYCFRRFFSHFSHESQALFFFPLLWTAWELIRGSILTGLPWLLIGYTQLHTPLAGFAPIIGVYGLTFLTLMISGALLIVSEKKSLRTYLLTLALILGLFISGYYLKHKQWTHPDGEPQLVSMVQGNIPQTIKWDSHYIVENINIYKSLTMSHLEGKLVIWPEGAVPVYANNVETFIQDLSAIAEKHHSSIIFGVPIQKDNKTYNGLLQVGTNKGEYLKTHLVPFGEFTPFKSITTMITDYFHIPMSDFDAGPDNQAPLKMRDLKIAPFICYEIIFPLQVWKASYNSNVLLNISDDSWFGRSLALPQQFEMAKMRSLETGRPQLIATNTGITAFISPQGERLESAPLDERVILTSMVQPMAGETPLMKMLAPLIKHPSASSS